MPRRACAGSGSTTRRARLRSDRSSSARCPEVVEVEPNDEPKAPQRLGLRSATVNGRLARAGDVDGFAVNLTRGQTLVADIEAARHLGSPMDAVLQVVSAEGFVLAQNDDDVGRDPRIVFEAPSDGTYIVRLFAFPATPDSSIRFAGADDYMYRLTLTTGGFLDYAFPLAVGRAGPAVVEAIGWNIPGPRFLPIGDPMRATSFLWPTLHWPIPPRSVGFPSPRRWRRSPTICREPQAIASPVALSGRIEPPGDQDVFRLSLQKGDKRVIRVESHALGRPLDPTLRILDPAGKILAESDDTGRNDRDLERSFTAPADGEYRFVIRDLNGRGGPRFAYLLSVLEPRPDFALVLASDRFDLTPGKMTKITVAVQRKDGLAEPIEIGPQDLPAGIAAKPVTSKTGDASARCLLLALSADDRARSGPFRITGRATKGTQTSHKAMAANAGFDAKTDWPRVYVALCHATQK